MTAKEKLLREVLDLDEADAATPRVSISSPQWSTRLRVGQI